MTEIYLIRHAEAEGNIYRRNHGQYDSLLTPLGREQVGYLEKRFENIRIDACFSSDLTRACMTAQAICRPKDLPLHRCPEFREVNFGVWEDKPFGYIDHFDKEAMDQFRLDPRTLHVPGGETFPEYTGRFIGKMTALAKEYDGKTIAIFSHGAALRGVLMELFRYGEGGPVPVCDNTGVSHIFYEDGAYRADYINDNSHLPRELSTFGRLGEILGEEILKKNMWFEPAGGDLSLLLDLYRETWDSIYGNEAHLQLSAVESFAAVTPPEYCQNAFLQGEPAGVILMRRGGRIVFLALTEPLRGQRLGSQLLGQAVSRFRAEGCNRITLAVSKRNERALAFYRKYGFREIGQTPGAAEPLIEMALDIDVKNADVPPISEI